MFFREFATAAARIFQSSSDRSDLYPAECSTNASGSEVSIDNLFDTPPQIGDAINVFRAQLEEAGFHSSLRLRIEFETVRSRRKTPVPGAVGWVLSRENSKAKTTSHIELSKPPHISDIGRVVFKLYETNGSDKFVAQTSLGTIAKQPDDKEAAKFIALIPQFNPTPILEAAYPEPAGHRPKEIANWQHALTVAARN